MSAPGVPTLHWIGLRAAYLRHARQLSTRQLARRAHLRSHTSIIALEHGTNVRLSTLLAVVQGLDVSLPEFFSEPI